MALDRGYSGKKLNKTSNRGRTSEIFSNLCRNLFGFMGRFQINYGEKWQCVVYFFINLNIFKNLYIHTSQILVFMMFYSLMVIELLLVIDF